MFVRKWEDGILPDFRTHYFSLSFSQPFKKKIMLSTRPLNSSWLRTAMATNIHDKGRNPGHPKHPTRTLKKVQRPEVPISWNESQKAVAWCSTRITTFIFILLSSSSRYPHSRRASGTSTRSDNEFIFRLTWSQADKIHVESEFKGLPPHFNICTNLILSAVLYAFLPRHLATICST